MRTDETISAYEARTGYKKLGRSTDNLKTTYYMPNPYSSGRNSKNGQGKYNGNIPRFVGALRTSDYGELPLMVDLAKNFSNESGYGQSDHVGGSGGAYNSLYKQGRHLEHYNVLNTNGSVTIITLNDRENTYSEKDRGSGKYNPVFQGDLTKLEE